MSAVVIVGAQWGDEGKGKIVDLVSADADLVIRYGGGANAGHTLVVKGEKVVFHLIPSAALHRRPRCVLGAGMVIDPKVLTEELRELASRSLLWPGRLLISERAHVVLPVHFLVDALRERGPRAIGTTKRGIGPCYEDRAARLGVRIGDFLDATVLRAKIADCFAAWRSDIEAMGGEPPHPTQAAEELLRYADELGPWIGDAEGEAHAARERGERIVLEGAQGTMLDIDHGTYPFVTSSSVTAGGACTGSGLGPTHVGKVIGITKAYTTRVGEGPFPTELFGEEGDALRKAGAEFGATTGRPRRCGWLDIPVLRHAARVNGLTELAITKLDVLTGRERIDICVGYERDGQRLDIPPATGLERATPIYESLPGWTDDVGSARGMADLPANARAYVDRIAELSGVPIGIVSVGADRDETIRLRDTF
ncbi:MAG: adenylosuccinate synthase [Sandaracinaceae bacterium]